MRDAAWVRIVAGVGFGLTILLGLASDGVHHDDDLTHFLMARWAAWFPEYLLQLWARPGFTLPHAAVAWIGSPQTAWHLCRVLSAAVTLVSMLLAVGVARRLGVRSGAVVAAACYAPPLACVLGATTLTENVAGLYLIGAVALLARGRRTTASAVFSAALVTRYDLLVLVPVWWAALLGSGLSRARGRQPPPRTSADRGRIWGSVPAACALSLWAPAAHQVLLWLLLDVEGWRIFARPMGSTDHPAAGLLAFVPHALHAVPPVITAAALLGGARLVRAGRWLVPALVGVFALAHLLLRAGGLFASGGYGRFLIAVAPLTAILISAGLTVPRNRRRWSLGTSSRTAADHLSPPYWGALAAVWLIGGLALYVEASAGRIRLRADLIAAVPMAAIALAGVCVLAGRSPRATRWGERRGRRRPEFRRAAAGIMALTWAVHFAAVVRPLRPNEGARHVQAAIGWIAAEGLASRPLLATSPWAAYYRGWVEHPRIRKGPRLAASMPVGSLILWDAVYAPNNYHRLPLATFRDDPAYRLLRAWPADATPAIRLFEKTARTPMPADEPAPYPPDLLGTLEPRGSYYVQPHR